MTIKILFIENQAIDMEIYTEPLRERFELDIAWDIWQACRFVEGDCLNAYDLVILDVMMPPEGVFSLEETNHGLLTGLRFFDRYLEGKPAQYPVAVLLMTAACGKALGEIKRYFRTKPQIIGLHTKNDTNPSDLKRAIEKWAESSNRGYQKY